MFPSSHNGKVHWFGFLDPEGGPMEGTGVYRINGNLAVARAIGDIDERPFVSGKRAQYTYVVFFVIVVGFPLRLGLIWPGVGRGDLVISFSAQQPSRTVAAISHHVYFLLLVPAASTSVSRVERGSSSFPCYTIIFSCSCSCSCSCPSSCFFFSFFSNI